MVFFGAIGLTAANVFLKNPSNYKKYAVAERVSLFGSPRSGPYCPTLGKTLTVQACPKTTNGACGYRWTLVDDIEQRYLVNILKLHAN